MAVLCAETSTLRREECLQIGDRQSAEFGGEEVGCHVHAGRIVMACRLVGTNSLPFIPLMGLRLLPNHIPNSSADLPHFLLVAKTAHTGLCLFGLEDSDLPIGRGNGATGTDRFKEVMSGKFLMYI